MTRQLRLLLVLFGCAFGCSRTGGTEQAKPTESVAQVRVAQLRRRSVSESLTVYGAIVSGPAGRQTLSVPYEAHVVHILVRQGQALEAGAGVIEIEPSADTRLAVQQARAAVESAHESLKAVQQSFENHLATNVEFEQAERSAREAELSLSSLSLRGSARSHSLFSPGPAVVSSIEVSEGAIVAAGNPLVELDFKDHREARFGLEVEDVGHVETASIVEVSDLELPPIQTVRATVRALSNAVNEQTRLVDLFAALPANAPFMLGQHVTGRLMIQGAPGLVIARSALLPVEDHLVVFSVVKDRAVAHPVRIGLETDREVELVASNLSENDLIVVEGALVLRDSMRVQVRKDP